MVLSDALGSGALGPVELCLTQIGAAQAICRAFSQVRCGIERLPCARPIGHGREVALANVLDLPDESVIAASFAGGGEQTHPGRTASPTRVWTTESPPFGISRDS